MYVASSQLSKSVLLPVVQWVVLYRQPIWWMVLLLYSLLILFWTNDCQSSLLVPFVLLISWRTSTSNRAAILVNVTKSGCEVLVHHFEIVAGSFLNCSDNHLLVRFFSTNTTFMRFISFIVYLYYCVQRKDNGFFWNQVVFVALLLLFSISVGGK